MKNVLDFFFENSPVPEIDLLTGFDFAVVISATEDTVYLRTYKVNIDRK